MGVLSDIVIAPAADARAIAESDGPCDQWRGVSYKGLDTISLASLWMILEGNSLDADAVVDQAGQFQATNSSKTGPWVFRLPPEFLAVLAGKASSVERAIRDVADAWNSTDEMADWEADEVADCLQQLIDLAESTILERQRMFLWISL